MVTILLQQIIDFLNNWVNSWNSHAQTVAQYLGLIEEDTSNLPDIKSNTDDIKDNTAAVITPINNIKSNTDSIATSSSTTASNTTIIKNNINTIATNTGSASAFAEDCANNTLDIKDKVTTIASDTTQIRATSGNIAADVSSINQALGYYLANTPVTEEVEGDLCNFNTDLEDYLQKAVVTIPADAGGYSSIDVYKNGKNLLSVNNQTFTQYVEITLLNPILPGNYVLSGIFVSSDVDQTQCNLALVFADDSISSNFFDRNTRRNKLITTTKVITKVRLYASTNYSGGAGDIATFSDLQIEAGDTLTDFEAYKENTDTVSLGSTITDGAEVDLLSGMVKINTTPVTYSAITPIAIRTYKGVNNIYSDIGSMNVIYRETLKHYLDKNNQ